MFDNFSILGPGQPRIWFVNDEQRWARACSREARVRLSSARPQALLQRLARLEGQVRGIARLIEEDR